MFRRWFGGKTGRHYGQGIEHFNRGDLARAIDAFDRVLRASEDDSHPYTTLARFYRAEALARLGEQNLARGRDGEALAYLEAALEEQPGYPDLHFRRGVALLRRGDAEAAERAARDALARNEDFVEARVLLALSLRDQGEEVASRRELTMARNLGRRRPHALSAYLEGRDEFPSAEALWAHLFDEQVRQERIAEADLLLHQGHLEESGERLAKLVEENPDFADLRLKLATVRFQMGDDASALTHLNRALDRNPRFANALILAGAVRLRQGDIVQAHEHFEAGREAGMPTPFADYGMAVCQVLLGRIAESVPLLSSVTEGENPPRAALLLAACARGMLGEDGLARRLFDRLLTGGDDPEVLLDALALSLEVDDLPRAGRLAERLPELEPDGLSPRLEVAYARSLVLARRGKTGPALQALGAFSNATAGEPGLACLLADLRAARGEVEAALGQYRAALAADPEISGIHARIADLLRAAGRHADALHELEQERSRSGASLSVELDYLFALRVARRYEAAEAQRTRLMRIFPLELAVRIQDPRRWLAPLAPAWTAGHAAADVSRTRPAHQPVA